MATKTIKTPSWVLLEALGHVDCELVDIDIEGGVVNLTVVEDDMRKVTVTLHNCGYEKHELDFGEGDKE